MIVVWSCNLKCLLQKPNGGSAPGGRTVSSSVFNWGHLTAKWPHLRGEDGVAIWSPVGHVKMNVPFFDSAFSAGCLPSLI